MIRPNYLIPTLQLALVTLILAIASSASAQARSLDGAWETLGESTPNRGPTGERWVSPSRAHYARLNPLVLLEHLRVAPAESQFHAQSQHFDLSTSSAQIDIPAPDGTFPRFVIAESPVMEPALADRFPDIKTYIARGVDDPSAIARLDWTPQGFHASVFSAAGAWYVDPAFRGRSDLYSSYLKRDLVANRRWQCYVDSTTPNFNTAARTSGASAQAIALASSGPSLRTYRLACAATGEYTAYQGGTVPLGLGAVVTAVNRVTQVYEADFAIRLVLVGNNDQLIYTDSKHDPYNNTNANVLLNQNQTNIDSVIGSANYDIGHVVGTGGGGLAYLGVVCSANKARGETGSPDPTGDAFYIDYVAHEMGHQFGADHSFNGITSNCSGANRNASTAMEPGSGNTIMSYAGICGADDLQPHSDPYFHSISYDEIMAYVTAGAGSSCPVISSTGNTAPTVDAGIDRVIPKLTPFTLTASGSDVSSDTITYCWEERDLGASELVTDPDNGASPIFRSWNPTVDPSRTFPRLADIIANTTVIGEQYPAVARSAMKFRVTVRDNRAGGGGSSTDDMQIQVVSTAGPFTVTSPNTAVSWSGIQTVTWNVANTNVSPINTTLVNITLSTDGGITFPITLVANTANDGSNSVTLPNINTTTARIRVEAVGNVYWDMSNANFAISAATPVNVSYFRAE